MQGRYPALLDWIRRRHRAGSTIYSACSGAVLLAATGLLNGREATSHWGYQDLFRTRFPEVKFPSGPQPGVRRSERAHRDRGRHHVLARSCDPHHRAPLQPRRGAADRQGVSAEVARRGPAALCQPGASAAPCRCGGAARRGLAGAALSRAACGRRGGGGDRHPGAQPEAALQGRDRLDADRPRAEPPHRGGEARCWRPATPPSRTSPPTVGYENPAFFRRLFKRCTGLTPGQYRRMFRPFAAAGEATAA